MVGIQRICVHENVKKINISKNLNGLFNQYFKWKPLPLNEIYCV